ncbi:MAG TPA: hypothetical protein VF707_19685 [Ardenticatenaceae bacterium]
MMDLTTLRGAARWLLAAALLLLGLVLPVPRAAGPAQAALQSEQRAGLLVSFGDGPPEKYCVDLGADGQASGEEVLREAGLPVRADYSSSFGAGVCQIRDVGCSFPAQSCFCQCTLNPGEPCRYWGYSHLFGGDWQVSNVGASSYTVRAGGVEGWAWGEATIGDVAEPPAIPFNEICLAPTATATNTPLPPPTATRTPEPTATWTPEPPTETPVPTETTLPTLEPATETPRPSATASNPPPPSATNTLAPSNTALPGTATASRVAATATRAVTSTRPPGSATATNPPSGSPTPLRPTWTPFPRSPTATEAAPMGGAGEPPTETPIPTPTEEPTDIPTLIVTLPTRTATTLPTQLAPPTETGEEEAALAPTSAPSATVPAIVVAPLEPTIPASETLVDAAENEGRGLTSYLIFAGMVVVLGSALAVLRFRQR